MHSRGRSSTPSLSDAARREIARIDAIFASQGERAKGRGPYMFGRRGIVDAFYLPMATRMRSYAITLGAAAGAYRDALLADNAFLHWESEAEASWRAMSRGDAEMRHR